MTWIVEARPQLNSYTLYRAAGPTTRPPSYPGWNFGYRLRLPSGKRVRLFTVDAEAVVLFRAMEKSP